MHFKQEFKQEFKHEGKPTYKHAYKLVLAVGIIISLIASYVRFSHERDRLEVEFNYHSQQLVTQLRTQMDIYSDEVIDLASLFDASTNVDYREFRTFSRPMMLQDGHQIHSTFYAPYITKQLLPPYLKAVRLALQQPNFNIFPVSDNQAYMPITYIEPSDGTLGFDIYNASLPYQSDIHLARDSGELVQTAPLSLIKNQLAGNKIRDSFVIRKAIYSTKQAPITQDQRRQQFLGVVGIAFNINGLLKPLINNNKASHLVLRISDIGSVYDQTQPTSVDTFYDAESSHANFWQNTPYKTKSRLIMAGRLWSVEVSPKSGLFASKVPLFVLLPLIFMLLLTLMLTLFVWRLTKEHCLALELAYNQINNDVLTDLLSREKIQSNLKLCIKIARIKKKQLGVLFIDLDHFKKINDTLGHQAGDELLKLVSQRLTNITSNKNHVGRLGGDEFLIIMEQTDANFPRLVKNHCRDIIDKLSTPYQVSHRSLTIGCSIGVAFYPDAGMDAGDLIKNADLAMYHAKTSGRSTYQVYTDAFGITFNKNVEVESQLRNAIGNNELHMVYQPKVDLRSLKIVGFEALIRWNNPALGVVGPDTFISVAEDSGQIVELGDWILSTVCQQIVSWLQAGYIVPKIAVNISPGQLCRTDFTFRLKSILKQYQLPPGSLDFELTEAILVQDKDTCLATLNKLKKIGITLSLDDFGTGYSSLSYLKRFPFDSVKIDRSFICDLNNDDNDVALTQAIIRMGHALGMEVIAEGVEDESQLAFLTENHCDTAQGYYFDRPLRVERVKQLLSRAPTKQTAEVFDCA
jgi:diguanylate cyclase (GGDEF)-like protein